ncbi:2Fe-2S iron-sulfur cluster binding domain-containing protein [Leptobacterium flavescens]|uniref:2Fe-2S iron-sulfur cluster binding domain-containing protein n=1 Tax=Leptobacterium flavescens TaxID=472055 RepID=A0A6P0UIV7_9FLAO|nr:ferredoxin--NADP reductase [Leptobacterium flavescens]NER11848.1 2Fe-2S iron-sulfur cluster binding domain-containing protein [Leptobacterium flavescens]
MSKFYKLQITDLRKETADSVSVAFDLPYELYNEFNYKAGQYLTVKFTIGGEEVRRSYSLCSSPVMEEPLRIGVKKVKGGLVSNHINDSLKVGDTVEVMVPEGRFTADIKEGNYKTYYLFSAGSGITPILSILRTVLFREPRSYVHMIYGNSNQESIMFQNELEQLQEQYFDRFVLVHSLSRPKSKWSDLWKSSKDKPYLKGRIDKKTVSRFIGEYPPYAQNAEYYICGPGTMIQNTKEALKDMDVPGERIFTESFGGQTEGADQDAWENATLIAHLDGEKIEVNVPKGKTLLRTLISQGKNPPYSCEGGVCSTCICKVKNGKVHMKNNLALTDEEVADGYALSCQSIPLTESVEIVYE